VRLGRGVAEFEPIEIRGADLAKVNLRRAGVDS